MLLLAVFEGLAGVLVHKIQIFVRFVTRVSWVPLAYVALESTKFEDLLDSREGCAEYTVSVTGLFLEAFIDRSTSPRTPSRFFAHTLSVLSWKSARFPCTNRNPSPQPPRSQGQPRPHEKNDQNEVGAYYLKQPGMMPLGIGVVWHGERGGHMCGGRREIGEDEGAKNGSVRGRGGGVTLGIPNWDTSMDFTGEDCVL